MWNPAFSVPVFNAKKWLSITLSPLTFCKALLYTKKDKFDTGSVDFSSLDSTKTGALAASQPEHLSLYKYKKRRRKEEKT